MLNALIFAAVVAISAAAVALWRFAGATRKQSADDAVQALLTLFAPAIVAVQQDPRHLLAWFPVAKASRTLFPEAFAALDRAAGARFPFSQELLRAAHARCSADWLTWERAHDAAYSLKTAEVQHEIAAAGQTAAQASPLLRTRLAAVEQEKLERYQERYEEYIRTSKALAAFIEG